MGTNFNNICIVRAWNYFQKPRTAIKMYKFQTFWIQTLKNLRTLKISPLILDFVMDRDYVVLKEGTGK
jgi:hypothetical protein